MRPRNVLISTTAAVAALGGGAALAWNTSEPDEHRADGKAAAVALRHPASGVERGGDTSECKLPAPRSELERALQRKLLREMAKHPPNFPKGWIVGQCNYGSASVP